MHRTRTLGIVLCLATVVTLASAQDPAAYDRAKTAYDESRGIGALLRRSEGIFGLAYTGDERAVGVLAERYKTAETPANQVKYLVAGALGELGATKLKATGAKPLWDFAKDQHKDLDGWLTYNALMTCVPRLGCEAALEVINARGATEFERAAAISALAHSARKEVLPVIPKLLEGKLGNALEQRVVLSACAGALLYLADLSKEKEFIAAARAVINQLDNAKLAEDTKLIIARHLARVFLTEKLWLNAEPWLRLLDAKPALPEDDKGKTAARRPTFFGLEGRGKRIAYVIDLSDSMLIPLKDEEIADLKKRVVTGKPGDKPEVKEEGIPWDRVKCRFDAAREVLKLSLRRLPEDASFFVVTFGTECKLLECTRRFLLATERNVGSAIAELDAITPGPVGPDRPNGTLMGDTNLHGGIVRAFRMGVGGLISGDDEHVNAATFAGGCDTIFVLSDGAPNTDDYPGLGELTTGMKGSVDREAGKSHTSGGVVQGRVRYTGPYAVTFHIVRDVRRMNLFRKVEINCVGVGESDDYLLEQIAGAGLGSLAKVGARAKTIQADPVPAIGGPKKPHEGPLIGPDDRRPVGGK
ncbi:MAG: hypothetical protein IT462_11875 [Planctomycetes bacterium]|nr:hypothetical protein [Planctomycetota bacterium]